MTIQDRERDDDLFDPLVAACMQRAAEDVPVNLEVEWVRLVDRLAREAEVAHVCARDRVAAAHRVLDRLGAEAADHADLDDRL